MIKPIPTVEQLVAIFKERDWKPAQYHGFLPMHGQAGRCCAAPAVALYIDPTLTAASAPNPSDVYKFIIKEYGEDSRSLMAGFDHAPTHKRGSRTENQCVWYDLGFNLYMALTGSPQLVSTETEGTTE